jgi:hypothetical protein
MPELRKYIGLVGGVQRRNGEPEAERPPELP